MHAVLFQARPAAIALRLLAQAGRPRAASRSGWALNRELSYLHQLAPVQVANKRTYVCPNPKIPA